MKIAIGQVVFTSTLFLSLMYIVLFSLLLSLGYWQLDRAKQKAQLLNLQRMQAKTVLELNASTQNDVKTHRYKTAKVNGHYDTAHQFLSDNQIFRGKAGYFVFTPFIIQATHQAILVNRGWLPANPNRKILPNVQIKTAQASVTGRINQFPSVGIKLAGADIPTQTTPAVVQLVNPTVLATQLGYPLFSFQLELDKTLPEGYTREWLENTLMPPEQHIAYAVQWFGLAFTLSILFFWYSIKKRTDD